MFAAAGVLIGWMPDLGLAPLASVSDVVVEGTVQSQESHTKTGRLLTETQVLVHRVHHRRANVSTSIKPEKLVSVTQTGGATSTIRTQVRGDATLREGERVLLFLFAGDKGRWHLTQLGLGAFVVEDDAFVQVLSDDLQRADGSREKAPVTRRFSRQDLADALAALARAAAEEGAQTPDSPTKSSN